MVNGALSFKPNPIFLTPIASADRQRPDSSAMSFACAMAWVGAIGPDFYGADDAWGRRLAGGGDVVHKPCARAKRKAPAGREIAEIRAESCLATPLSGIESREAAFEIGLEVLDILQSDVEPQGWAAGRPFGGCTIARAVEWNDEALEAAPRVAHAE